MKKLITLLIVIVILILGIGLSYFYLIKPTQEQNSITVIPTPIIPGESNITPQEFGTYLQKALLKAQTVENSVKIDAVDLVTADSAKIYNDAVKEGILIKNPEIEKDIIVSTRFNNCYVYVVMSTLTNEVTEISKKSCVSMETLKSLGLLNENSSAPSNFEQLDQIKFEPLQALKIATKDPDYLTLNQKIPETKLFVANLEKVSKYPDYFWFFIFSNNMNLKPGQKASSITFMISAKDLTIFNKQLKIN